MAETTDRANALSGRQRDAADDWIDDADPQAALAAVNRPIAAASSEHRQRDADLARRLGWGPEGRPNWWGPKGEYRGVPFHSFIEKAWLVVEEMRRWGYKFFLDDDDILDDWDAVFFKATDQERVGIPGSADTAPEAICRAALLALGEEGDGS